MIWHSWGGTYFEAIQKQLADYAAKNNVTLELLNVPDLNQKVNVAIPAGQGPDIVAWVNDQIGKNAELDVIQPLDAKGIDKAFLDQNEVPAAATAMQYKGKVYGVPESMEAIAFIYNKDLVKESDLPKTTDELLQKAADFNKANAGKYYFVQPVSNGDAYHAAPWWYGFGAYYVKEDGTVGLNTPESINAGKFLQKLSQVMPKEIDNDISKALFTDKKAAIWLTGPWSVADLQKANMNFGIATIPTVTATNKPASPFVGVKCMMLAKGAKNEAPAIALMKYYGGTEFQVALAKANKQVPANKAAEEQVKGDPIIAGFLQQTLNGVPLPNTPFMDALWQPTADAEKAIWSGAQTPEAALKAAAQVATDKIAQIK
ncbi:MAG: extracellular solute-binding protein [Herpetosiphon sp.]